MHNRGENFSLKNFYLFKIVALHPRSIVHIAITAIPTVACWRELPQSPAVTAPSVREPLDPANFGHRIVGRDDSARRGFKEFCELFISAYRDRKRRRCNFHKYIEGAQHQFK